MTEDRDPCHSTDRCISCGDIAVILTVIDLIDRDALCRDEAGFTERVAIELVAGIRPGDQLLVHAGVALQRISGDRTGA